MTKEEKEELFKIEYKPEDAAEANLSQNMIQAEINRLSAQIQQNMVTMSQPKLLVPAGTDVTTTSNSGDPYQIYTSNSTTLYPNFWGAGSSILKEPYVDPWEEQKHTFSQDIQDLVTAAGDVNANYMGVSAESNKLNYAKKLEEYTKRIKFNTKIEVLANEDENEKG